MPLDDRLLSRIDRAITREGLRNEKKHLDEAKRCLDFYHAQFKAWPVTPLGPDAYTSLRPRTTPVMQRVVNVLTGKLYQSGPKRKLADHPEASAWLEQVYKVNAVDAMFQRADQLATAADYCAFQVVPTNDPLKPLKILLWDASQLAVWLDPDDQTQPVAIATIDQYDEQRRLRLWTNDLVRVYMTDRVKDTGQTAGATAFTFRNEVANPFGLMPFAFVHFHMPIQDFNTCGPGSHLADVNEALNASLTRTGGSVDFNLIPILFLTNVSPGYRLGRIAPGDVRTLPRDMSQADGGATGEPKAEYLQADSSFVAASWEDLQSYFDLTLEMHGVPKSAVRMEQDSLRSGVSIVADQVPLVEWARSRQRPFGYYEQQLATLVLTIGASHYALNADDGGEMIAVTSQQLAAAASDPELTLRWPKMTTEMPGEEQDRSDQWLLENRMTSPQEILMRREGWTKEETDEYSEKIAGDWTVWHRLFGEADMAEAATQAAKAGMMREATEPDGDESKPTKPAEAESPADE